MEIKSLGNTDFDTLFRAFERAFADYDVQLDKTQLQAMLKRRGFDPGLSFAAFDGREIAAFTLNGIGHFDGKPTAYDTGTGTLNEYRGQGLAAKIFEHSIPHLRASGIGLYLLEVLQHNAKAVSIYSKLGFETTREFNYFIQRNDRIVNGGEIPAGYSIRRLGAGEFSPRADFQDFNPSWQNSINAIRRAAGDFIVVEAVAGKELAGYGVFEPAAGDITQLAVGRRHRRRGVASALLREMLRLNRNDSVKVVNTEVSCNAFTHFLEAKNIGVSGRQFEMTRLL